MFLTNQLQLTPSQRQHLEELEKQSFCEFCRRLGKSPKELENILLNLAKEEIELTNRMASIAYPELASEAYELAKDALSSNDWETYKQITVRQEAEHVANHIAMGASHLPINWSYLRNLSKRLGIPSPTSKDPKSIIPFILAIPHLRMYGMEFNACLMPGATLDNIPYISIYERLITAVELFFDVVLKAIVVNTSDEKAVPATLDVLRQRGRDPIFVDECMKCIDTILCRTPYTALRDELRVSRSVPKLDVPFRLMVSGATSFVWSHEYGHLLMGHLLKTPCHKVEYEADVFAWKTIYAANDNASSSMFGWYLLGGLSFLTVLALIDFISGNGKSKNTWSFLRFKGTHPSGECRLRALLDKFDKNIALGFLQYIEGILVVCEYTIYEGFGVRYRSLL